MAASQDPSTFGELAKARDLWTRIGSFQRTKVFSCPSSTFHGTQRYLVDPYKAINEMSRDKSDGNMIASSIPSSFEKRLMALEFDMKRKNENNSSKALSDEIERLELEQLKQKKVLKSVESNLKKFEKKFDSGSQDLHDNKSVASSKRSGKSKADRKIEKEIEKMKENYGSIKSEIGIKLNDQSEFIEEMANMKARDPRTSGDLELFLGPGPVRSFKFSRSWSGISKIFPVQVRS